MAPPAEISIPTTSVSSSPDGGKPYTLYNITLRLPLRSFVVQKRYSEFVELHNAITSVVGAPPPAPLPGKSWFKSTVSSPELTEERRLGLERYLRAIAESPDRRWRDTPAWRAFLNLPSTGGGGSNSAASASGVSASGGVASSAAATGADHHHHHPAAWLDLHRELKAALHEARIGLARRDAATDAAARAEAGNAARRALVRAGSLISLLQDGLRALREEQQQDEGSRRRGGRQQPPLPPQQRLGEGELRRRGDLLAAAKAERDGLEKLCASLAAASVGGGGPGAGWQSGGGGLVAGSSAGDKAALLGNANARGSSSSSRAGGGRILGAPLPETERTRELDNGGVLQLQREMMREQDEDVEALAQIVRRQKDMGLAIKDEVDRQIEYMDRMNEDVDRLAGKVGVAKNRVRKLG